MEDADYVKLEFLPENYICSAQVFSQTPPYGNSSQIF